MDGVLLDLDIASLLGNSNNGRLSTLCNDNGSLSLLVLLGQKCDVLGNLLDILGLQVMALGVSLCFCLVSDEVVPVRCALVKRVLEELANEGSTQTHDEDLVVGSGFLREGKDGGHANSQVEASDVVVLSGLDEGPDLLRLEMVELVVVCGGQVGAKRSVVASDDNTASSSGVLFVDTVFGPEAGLLAGVAQSIGVLVLANTTNVQDGVGREYVLGATSSVLGSTTCNELRVMVLDQVLVETKVLLFGENSVVGLEAVLLEQLVITKANSLVWL